MKKLQRLWAVVKHGKVLEAEDVTYARVAFKAFNLSPSGGIGERLARIEVRIVPATRKPKPKRKARKAK